DCWKSEFAPRPHLNATHQNDAPRHQPLTDSKSSSSSKSRSIHPSEGKASTGRWFCHRLKRSRTRTVSRSELFGPCNLSSSIGAASNHLRGMRNSKFRSRTTRVESDELSSTLSAWVTCHERMRLLLTTASNRNSRL